jgi:hypothetical protein
VETLTTLGFISGAAIKKAINKQVPSSKKNDIMIIFLLCTGPAAILVLPVFYIVTAIFANPGEHALL